jgi:outer membrane protein assembly factor BamC
MIIRKKLSQATSNQTPVETQVEIHAEMRTGAMPAVPLRTVAAQALVIGAVVASMTGCGMISSVMGNDKVDYKGAKKAAPLDVPPDLTQLQKDNRYTLPESTNGVATASGYNAQRNAAPGAAAASAAEASGPQIGEAPAGSGIRVERSGNQRWLVVKQTPEALWPQLKTFWEDAGMPIVTDVPAAGIMETDWVETHPDIADGIVRGTLTKIFNSISSTGLRDKYRTRVERLPDGSSEIYISQRGAEEVLQGSQKDTTAWTMRPNDPGLEAQQLARLMTALGSKMEPTQAKLAVDQAAVQPLHAKLVGEGAERSVEVDEGFDRAWRRVGLALDRVGFTVEDRDRTQGVYFVRYVSQDAAKTEGFFKKLFSWGSDSEKDKEAQRYRIVVKAAATGSTSNVTVLTNEGKVDSSPTSGKILDLLNEQLK